MKAGLLKSVRGGSATPDIGQQFRSKYLIEAPDQGVPVNYSDPDSLTANGMDIFRRIRGNEGGGTSFHSYRTLDNARRSLDDELFDKLAEAGVPELADTGVNSVDDLVSGYQKHLAEQGVKLEPAEIDALRQQVRQSIVDDAQRFAHEQEVLFPQGLDVRRATVHSNHK